MSATIELLPRKEFRITLESGNTISGKFGTWALKRFCSKKNISLSQAAEMFLNTTVDDLVDYILSAVEQSFREAKTGTAFPYNDVDVCAWIDELGGVGAASVTSLFNHAGDAEPEKKSNEPENL